jgi:hypothetical protein
MRSVGAWLGIALALAIAPLTLANPAVVERVSLGGEVRLSVPKDFERDRLPFGRGEIITLSRGDEVLVISLYRKGLEAAPSAEAARKAHVERLVKALGAKATPVSVRPARLLGRARATTALSLPAHPERSGIVVAASEAGLTLVVTAMFKTDGDVAAQLESLLGSITVAADAP